MSIVSQSLLIIVLELVNGFELSIDIHADLVVSFQCVVQGSGCSAALSREGADA